MPRYLANFEFHGDGIDPTKMMLLVGFRHGFFCHERNHLDRVAYLPAQSVIGSFPNVDAAHAHFVALLDEVRRAHPDVHMRRYTITNADDRVFVSLDEVYVGDRADAHPEPTKRPSTETPTSVE